VPGSVVEVSDLFFAALKVDAVVGFEAFLARVEILGYRLEVFSILNRK
jgi:hypothetical protein